jgi:hypothetical protein
VRPMRAPWPRWLRLREVRDEEAADIAVAVNCRIDLHEIKARLRHARQIRVSLCL